MLPGMLRVVLFGLVMAWCVSLTRLALSRRPAIPAPARIRLRRRRAAA